MWNIIIFIKPERKNSKYIILKNHSNVFALVLYGLKNDDWSLDIFAIFPFNSTKSVVLAEESSQTIAHRGNGYRCTSNPV